MVPIDVSVRREDNGEAVVILPRQLVESPGVERLANFCLRPTYAAHRIIIALKHLSLAQPSYTLWPRNLPHKTVTYNWEPCHEHLGPPTVNASN